METGNVYGLVQIDIWREVVRDLREYELFTVFWAQTYVKRKFQAWQIQRESAIQIPFT